VLSYLTQLGDRQIADTVAAVFRGPEFVQRTIYPSWLTRALEWIARQLGRLFSSSAESPVAYWTLVTMLALFAAAVLARALYVAYVRQTLVAGAPGERRARGRGRSRDPWLVAQEQAARGDFTEAAHALYRALLETLARRERVRLHPSKTVGDYVRDLRRNSSAVFQRFRDFARSYEVVVYGVGACDQERYERLLALATPIIRPG
jgi:hypothetical protein